VQTEPIFVARPHRLRVIAVIATIVLIGLTLVSQLMANWRTLASVVSMSLAVLALRALLDEAGASLLVVLVASIPAAAATYVGTGLALWALTGFQKGPESEIADIARRALRRS